MTMKKMSSRRKRSRSFKVLFLMSSISLIKLTTRRLRAMRKLFLRKVNLETISNLLKKAVKSLQS